jgi:hypothetical protein
LRPLPVYFFNAEACKTKFFRGKIPFDETEEQELQRMLLNNDTIPGLLVRDVPRGLVLAIEDGLTVAAQRAFAAAQGMDKGHLPHVLGQLRHFHSNEGFRGALAMNDASPSEIRGNEIVTGRSGVFNLARYNAPDGALNNARRSFKRRQLSKLNDMIELLVQPDLFRAYEPPADATVFFVTSFDKSLLIRPDSPASINIAVPDQYMRRWIFWEKLSDFLQRYDVQQVAQPDTAVPKLKKKVASQGQDGTA